VDDVLSDPYCSNKLSENSWVLATGLGHFLTQLARVIMMIDVNSLFDYKENIERSEFLSQTTSFNAPAGREASATTQVDEVDQAMQLADARLQRELSADFVCLALQVIASTLSAAAADTAVAFSASTHTEGKTGEGNSSSLVDPRIQLLDIQSARPFMTVLSEFLRGRDFGTRRQQQRTNINININININSGSSASMNVIPGDDARLCDCVRSTLQLLGNWVYKCPAAQVCFVAVYCVFFKTLAYVVVKFISFCLFLLKIKPPLL
jgi:hypothetical protein